MKSLDLNDKNCRLLIQKMLRSFNVLFCNRKLSSQGDLCLPDGPLFLNPESLIHAFRLVSSVSEVNAFNPLKSPKNRFQLSIGLNFENFNTNLSGLNKI